MRGYALARAERKIAPRPDRTFEEWVTSRFGRPLYERFFGPYTEKLWGMPPSQISADWAAERISLIDLRDVALRLLGLRRTPTRTYARRYLYPRLGMGQLYCAMADEIARCGGVVRTGVRVVGLEIEAHRIVGVRIETSSGSERVPAGELLSTMPLPDLVRQLRRELPEPLARAARALRFRALTFVNLMLRRPDFSENTWMYVGSGSLSISRIQEPKRRSAAMAPPGHSSLMLEVPCNAGDATYRASVDELLPRMHRELVTLGFAVDDVLGAFCARVEHGYPVYHLDYDRDRRLLLSEVQRFANVRTAGRQGLFRYVFMDTAMQMGLRAAEQMLLGQRDPTALDAMGRASSVVEAAAVTA
jgi:protoporphyrinogen oxidase